VTKFVHTPEISEKLRELAPSHTVQEIARIVGIAPNSVTSFCKVAGIKIKPGRDKQRFSTKISIDAAVEMQRAADSRRMDVNDLICKLLETIAKDHMFDAILDDGHAT